MKSDLESMKNEHDAQFWSVKKPQGYLNGILRIFLREKQAVRL